ncbi:MAG: NADH-quinone oxidoreductase subunit NuoH [Bryobacterales bacterium]|nr:NADH-quinone oxidoreductase subunit NuoH [Bryobacterales bacterium]
METVLQNPLFWPLVTAAAILGLFPLVVGYVVLVERKILADMQTRLGPMRVGPHGVLQPIADALKLLLKEDVIPAEANKWIFWLAPAISFFTALTAMAVIPFSDKAIVADVNVGLLIITAMSSVGILGIVLGGWSSNSHYSLLGSLRSAAQLVSYEVALGLALMTGVMCAGTLSMAQIVRVQQERGLWFIFDNYGLMIASFVVFFIAAIAETNRAPFDLPEAESELVAGFHTEYSGFRWGIYMLAEYGSMFVQASVAITLFLGGWLRPFPSVAWLAIPLNYAFPFLLFAAAGLGCIPLARRLNKRIHIQGLYFCAVCLAGLGALFLIPAVNALVINLFWFLFKLGVMIYIMIWLRGTFPRYRYDQLMNIGWKVLIPVSLGLILANALVGIAKAG